MFFSRTHTLVTSGIPGEIPGSVLTKDPVLLQYLLFPNGRLNGRNERTGPKRGRPRPRLAFTTSRALSGTGTVHIICFSCLSCVLVSVACIKSVEQAFYGVAPAAEARVLCVDVGV